MDLSRFDWNDLSALSDPNDRLTAAMIKTVCGWVNFHYPGAARVQLLGHTRDLVVRMYSVEASGGEVPEFVTSGATLPTEGVPAADVPFAELREAVREWAAVAVKVEVHTTLYVLRGEEPWVTPVSIPC